MTENTGMVLYRYLALASNNITNKNIPINVTIITVERHSRSDRFSSVRYLGLRIVDTAVHKSIPASVMTPNITKSHNPWLIVLNHI